MKLLQIEDIDVSVEQKQIIKNLSLEINQGEVHVIMGPNGSGKSTLSLTLAGHPKYKLNKGKIIFNGKDLERLSPAERSCEGFFLAFQYPVEISGISLRQFLYTIYKQRKPDISPTMFKQVLEPLMAMLNFDHALLDRELNVGFSGGEKKRLETLQLLLLQPIFAVLDETDSGLDVDSLKCVANAINLVRNKNFSAIVITHYPHLLQFVNPDFVHIMVDGKIVCSGEIQLAGEIEKNGYQKWLKR